MKLLLQLFGAFFKIGAFTFGSGYAMITMIEKEVVDRRMFWMIFAGRRGRIGVPIKTVP